MPEYFNKLKESTPSTGIWQQFILNTLSKLNLVTREEFMIQTQVLQKLRTKVAALEKQLLELEARRNP